MNLPRLIGHQTEILYLPEEKNLFVTGSAGSGKSLLALYRVYWLAKVNLSENVVLLTFNKPVNNDMKEKLATIASSRNEEVPHNLTVDTYHIFMKKLITQLWEYYGNEIPLLKNYINEKYNVAKNYNNEKNKIVEQALEIVRKNHPQEKTLQRPLKVFIDEIRWMQQMSIQDEAEYIEAERIGRRDTRIERAKRPYFYEVYQKYQELRASDDYEGVFDFEDVGTKVREILSFITDKEEFNRQFKYKYVFIDEFQDFTSDMLMTINELLGNYGFLTLLGDVNQGVFGKRVSFKSLGINMNRFKRHTLDNNYRNTKEISEFAELITESDYFDKSNEYYINAKKGKREGKSPKIIIYKDKNKELAEIMRYLEKIKQTDNKYRNIAIIVPTHKYKDVKNQLEKNHIEYKNVRDAQKNGMERIIYLGTYFQIKGLEFDIVFMPFMDTETFKETVSKENEELNLDDETFTIDQVGTELLEEHIARIYVGITRARERLYITATDELSPLLNTETFEKYLYFRE